MGWDGDAGRTRRNHRERSEERRSCLSGETSVIQGESGQGHTRAWGHGAETGSDSGATDRGSEQGQAGCELGKIYEHMAAVWVCRRT